MLLHYEHIHFQGAESEYTYSRLYFNFETLASVCTTYMSAGDHRSGFWIQWTIQKVTSETERSTYKSSAEHIVTPHGPHTGLAEQRRLGSNYFPVKSG